MAVLLILVAVMSFSVCVILGDALNISSQTVMESQMAGRSYEYDALYPTFLGAEDANENSLQYARWPGTIAFDGQLLEHSIIGLYGQGEQYTLLDATDASVFLPGQGQVIIGSGLAETYGLKPGDTLSVTMEEADGIPLQVSAIAANAEANSINQATDVLVGCILFFLALYVNFQDNTRDMLILHLMGYRVKAIRKMLIDIYRPLVWLCFLLTLLPSIWLAKSIMRNLSISTGDYMPFGINIVIVIIAFAALTLIYQFVQWVFGTAIKRVIQKEDIAEYTGAE